MPDAVAVVTPAANGPAMAPDASRTRQGLAVDHFHVYLLWHPLWEIHRRQVLATATVFDEACDAYDRRLDRYESAAGPGAVRVYCLGNEQGGALVVYLDITHLVWVGCCDQPDVASCRHRQDGWYDDWPHGPVRPLEDPVMTYDIPVCTIPDCPRQGQFCRHERRAALLAAPPFEAWVDAVVDAALVDGLLELGDDDAP